MATTSSGRRATSVPVQAEPESVVWLLPLGVVTLLSIYLPSRANSVGIVLAVALVTIIGRRYSLRFGLPDVLAGMLLMFSLVSLNWSVAPEATGDYLRTIASGVLIFVGWRQALHSELSWRFFGGLMWATGAALAVAVVLVGQSSEALVDSASGEVYVRTSLLGVNPNYHAYMALVAFICLGILIRNEPDGRWRQVIRVSGILSMVAIAIAMQLLGSRGALVGCALASASLVLPSRIVRLQAPVLGAVALTLGFISITRPSGYLEALSWLVDSFSRTGVSGRDVLASQAVGLWRESPLIGNGGGVFPALNDGIHAHSIILDTAVGLGVVGLAMVTALAFSCFSTAWKRGLDSQWRISRARAVAALGWGLLPVAISGVILVVPVVWAALAFVSRYGVVGHRSATGQSQQHHHEPPYAT